MKQNARNLLYAATTAAVVVATACGYWYGTNQSLKAAEFVSYYVLFLGLVATGGIHNLPPFTLLFFMSWLFDTLILWGIFWFFRSRKS
jgi:hypothetical protein